MTGLVEIHHVVPREFKNHPTVLKYGYDVESDYNTIFVPSARGVAIGLRRYPIHTGGHMAYNTYTRRHLETITCMDSFIALICLLFQTSRGRRTDVPWRRDTTTV